MIKLIVTAPLPHDDYYKAIREIYSITFNPRFIARQLMFLGKMRRRDWQFLFTYSIRAIRRVRQHIFNLTRNEGKQTEAERVSVSA
jgi:hypothetical protein